MKLFKSMSLTESVRLYEKIKNSDMDCTVKNIFLDDIYFFKILFDFYFFTVLLPNIIPADISTNDTKYCHFKTSSPSNIAPNKHAKSGSANFIINKLDKSLVFNI